MTKKSFFTSSLLIFTAFSLITSSTNEEENDELRSTFGNSEL